jgi:cell division transport system permease protein
MKESFSFNIVLQDNTSDEQIKNLRKLLEKAPFIRSAEYVSKEEAAKQLALELGENIEEFIGFNPLPTLINVQLKAVYATPDSLAYIENQIKGFSSNIEEIKYQKELMQTVNDNLQKIELIIFGVAVLLLIISFALINNTIRLMIYSKRFLIHTMKLVGAKSNFIRKPFILSNLVLGIIASFIAIGLLLWVIHYASLFLDFWELIDWYGLSIVFGSVFGLGIFISLFATYIAVNKYMRMDYDNLYYI